MIENRLPARLHDQYAKAREKARSYGKLDCMFYRGEPIGELTRDDLLAALYDFHLGIDRMVKDLGAES